MMAVLVSVTAGGSYLGAAVIARHRAQGAADLAALAAAARLPEGTAAACAHAREVSDPMGAIIVRCEVVDLDVVIAADIAITPGRFGRTSARALARAGPIAPTE